MASDTDLHDQVSALLEAAGLPRSIRRLSPCRGSGNNRIYRVETEQTVLAAKEYFRHDDDVRDRLATEYSFSLYAAAVAPGSAPRPYAWSRETGIALYEFLEGKAPRAGEIGWSQLEYAVDFFLALNKPAARSTAGPLPTASEACFTLDQHLRVVSNRIRDLLDAPETLEVDRSAKAFVRDLERSWRDLVSSLKDYAKRSRLETSSSLDPAQRCLSPSDFGFHNAVVSADGAVRFLDFEYAGWDDPAKTAGDFFAQVEVPVPEEFFDRFVGNIMAVFPMADQLVERARWLRPVYKMKWCCIALNVFLPVNLARRRFAIPGLDDAAFKRVQLAKAQDILRSVEEGYRGVS